MKRIFKTRFYNTGVEVSLLMLRLIEKLVEKTPKISESPNEYFYRLNYLLKDVIQNQRIIFLVLTRTYASIKNRIH